MKLVKRKITHNGKIKTFKLWRIRTIYAIDIYFIQSNKIFDFGELEDCDGYTDNRIGDNFISIYLKDEAELNVLVHEIVHTVNRIMDYIGHDSKIHDEPDAYLAGYLFKKFSKKMKF